MHRSPEKKLPRQRDKFDSSADQHQLLRRAAREQPPRARKFAPDTNMDDVRWDTEPPDKRS